MFVNGMTRHRTQVFDRPPIRYGNYDQLDRPFYLVEEYRDPLDGFAVDSDRKPISRLLFRRLFSRSTL